MNRLQCLRNEVFIGDESRPRRASLRLAMCLWAISHWIVIGCDSKVPDGGPQNAQPAVALESSPSPTSPPIEELTPRNTNRVATPPPEVIAAPATEQIAAPAPAQIAAPAPAQIAAPSAAQIERWSPAPFEPLQLLAIREWEKTSFTRQLAATPDGRHFIAAGSRVLLWSVTGKEPDHVFLELSPDDQERSVLSLDVSPDGRWFAAGDTSGTVRIWSLDDRQEIVVKRLGSTGIQGLAISPDAQEIATISYDNEITTWTAATLQQQKKFTVDTDGLQRIEYLAPRLLAAAGESTSLWNTSTGAVVQTLSPGRYSFALARSPDGARFIFGGDGALHLWNVAEARPEAQITQGVAGSELLAYSPNGEFLATCNGRSVQLWNLAERRAAQVIDSFGWPIVGLSWLPETSLLVVASDMGCNRIWGTASQGATAGNTVSYRPQADLVQIETTLLRKLPAAGWTGFVRLNSANNELPDQRQLNFLRHGTTLQVSIGRFPADLESYVIQHALFFNNSSLPVPPDAGLVEFDGSTEPVLVATTNLTLDETRQFYDHELTTQGWLIRPMGRSIKEDHHWLSYLRGQSDLTIGLTKLPDGRTLVRVGKAVGSLWELSQANVPPAGPTDAVGLEAADLPGLNAALSAKFDVDGKSIELQVEDATLAAVAQRFSESLAALGWTLGEGGIRAEDYTLLTFSKEGKEIALRARVHDGKAVVNFQGDGLLWNKELPTGKQVISYESWLRQNNQPAGLEWLDQYESEMRAIHASPAAKAPTSQ